MSILFLIRYSIKYPIMITPGISIINRSIVNLYPNAPISNNNVENLVTHQALRKIIILENLTPFLISTAVNGNAAYMGPAEKNAIKKEINIPLIPELSPIYFIKYFLGTQISKRLNMTITGGRIDSIWIKLEVVILKILYPIFILYKHIKIQMNKLIKKYLYLFITNVKILILVLLL